MYPPLTALGDSLLLPVIIGHVNFVCHYKQESLDTEKIEKDERTKKKKKKDWNNQFSQEFRIQRQAAAWGLGEEILQRAGSLCLTYLSTE